MKKNEREFARIEVRICARVRQLEEDEIETVQTSLRIRPSVWAPSGESGLREMVTQSAGSHDSLLAQAILDISAQIVKLRSRFNAVGQGDVTVDVIELSGGGGRLDGPLPMKEGERLELWLDDDEHDAPPIRALIEVRHRYPGPEGGDTYGFRFETIHPSDQERLIRFIYTLQRQALREANT